MQPGASGVLIKPSWRKCWCLHLSCLQLRSGITLCPSSCTCGILALWRHRLLDLEVGVLSWSLTGLVSRVDLSVQELRSHLLVSSGSLEGFSPPC